MILHWRDPASVAIGGRIYSLIPSGEFQPSSIIPWTQAEDLNLWRNMVREYSEELLNTPEHDGSKGDMIDYQAWPLYQTLTTAKEEGRVRAFYLGLASNPLSLGSDLLTVVVLDDDIFDSAFRTMGRSNTEGVIVDELPDSPNVGLTFDQETIDQLIAEERVAPSSAACLHLAWQHRTQLIG